MNIELKKEYLPDTIEDLQRFVLIGRERLTAVKAGIRAIEKLDLAQEVREQKKEEAQDLASALLDAEVKIGELLKPISGSTAGTTRVLPEGITKKQSHYCQTLAENKEIVEQVKADAKEKEDLPTRTEVLRRVKEIKRVERFNKEKNELNVCYVDFDEINKKYDVLYVDPPWSYSDKGESKKISGYGAVDQKYTTLSFPDIKLMDINKICKKDVILYLWVTSPYLELSFELIQCWGFKYKSSFVWDKIKHNMGFYNSVRHEFLLICTKGNITPWNKKLFDSVYCEERTHHSKKPDYFYEVIEILYPGSDKIELFARKKRIGWDSWGNQID